MHGHQWNTSPFFFRIDEIDDHNNYIILYRATPGWSSSFVFGFCICFRFPLCLPAGLQGSQDRPCSRTSSFCCFRCFRQEHPQSATIFVQQTNYPATSRQLQNLNETEHSASRSCTCPYFKPGQQTELGKDDGRYTIRS